MSGQGISPLALMAPDLYAKQIAIQRRQALAQSLLGDQMAPQAAGQAYSGLANAGNRMLGAFLAKGADSDMANLYSGQGQQQAQPQSQQPADIGQVSNTPTQPTTPLQQTPATQQPQGQPQPQMGQPRTIPQAMSSAIPALPGLSQQQSMMEYLQDPQDYWKAIAPTPEYRNALQAAGGNQQMAQQLLMGAAQKASSETLRPGGGSVNFATNQVMTMPNTNGVQTNFPGGIYGGAQMSMVPGAAPALAQSAASQAVPKAMFTPATGYGPNNQPVASNALTMSGNAAMAPQLGLGPQPQQPLGLRSNNPGNLQPGGQEATYATPAEGIIRASQNLDNYAAKGINTVNGIVSQWAPQSGGNNTAAYTSYVAQKLGVDPNQPLPLNNPTVKGRVLDAIFSYENGPGKMQQAGAQPPQGLLPELPQGQAPYMQGQGKDASDRHDAIVAAASESPMRINVLDNIINLSKQGVATGPGQEWQNSVLGYAANSPVLSKIMGGAKDNVGRFQELQKFTYQNAIRSWQAAGGTGTDAQMQSMAHANPNDALFPQTLQAIAQWGKAAELAVQGKANAQDRFLAQNGQTPQNQIAFENQWRNAFDPKAFQYSLLQTPQEKQQFIQQNGITQPAARALLAKQQQLKAMGAIP